MAYQDGIAAPTTRLEDLPRRFGAYAPEDFDRSFQGSVTAAEALRRSLNLPAVALLDRVGPIRFAASLKAAGVGLRLPQGADPALPLALGGAGVTLRDLAGLYAALGTDGTARPLALQPGPAEPRGFLAPRAAAAIAGVLVQRFPDGGPEGVAWKTGTSWGGRDAWALGFDAAHVAGIWVGRPDGTPLPGATGRNLALPLLGRLFDLLPPAPRQVRPEARPAPAAAQEDALRLLFPPPGAVLSQGRVTVRAMGGRRPLTLLVDGVRQESDPARREIGWTPPGPGFYRLTVLDAEGAAARASVRVR
jgi:penicillin-binding protein 1C